MSAHKEWKKYVWISNELPIKNLNPPSPRLESRSPRFTNIDKEIQDPNFRTDINGKVIVTELLVLQMSNSYKNHSEKWKA